jgi:hypothetical protein
MENEKVDELLDLLSIALEEKKARFIFKIDESRADGPAIVTQKTPPTSKTVEIAYIANKQIRSADQIHAFILSAMLEIPDFPKKGVAITVYGLSPWNAVLTFAPGSTSSKNAGAYRDALSDIVEKLRTQFDLESE